MSVPVRSSPTTQGSPASAWGPALSNGEHDHDVVVVGDADDHLVQARPGQPPQPPVEQSRLMMSMFTMLLLMMMMRLHRAGPTGDGTQLLH